MHKTRSTGFSKQKAETRTEEGHESFPKNSTETAEPLLLGGQVNVPNSFRGDAFYPKLNSETSWPQVKHLTIFQGGKMLVLGPGTQINQMTFVFEGQPTPPKTRPKLEPKDQGFQVYFRTTPHPVTVTTRIISFLVGNPYKPSFVAVTGWGVDQRYINLLYTLDVYHPLWKSLRRTSKGTGATTWRMLLQVGGWDLWVTERSVSFFIAFGKLTITFFGSMYGVYRIHVWCIGKVESVE